MASYEETRKFCPDCGRNVVAKRRATNHILHLLLTIFTMGFWLLYWITRFGKFGGWHCGICGSGALKRAQ